MVIQSSCTSASYSLPEKYTNVPAVACKIENLSLPDVNLVEVHSYLELAKVEETKWTEKAQRFLIKDKLNKDDFISWAAFHASTQSEPVDPPALTALLPLFSEKAATIECFRHVTFDDDSLPHASGGVQP